MRLSSLYVCVFHVECNRQVAQYQAWHTNFTTVLTTTARGLDKNDGCHVAVQGYGDEDYLVFDCPGQIELYNHLTVFKTFVDFLRQVITLIVFKQRTAHGYFLSVELF